MLFVLLLPLKEQDGNDNADDEDHSQHRTHHPQKTFFLVHDWLRIHVGGGDGLGVRTGGVHCLEGGGRQMFWKVLVRRPFLAVLFPTRLILCFTHVLREVEQRQHEEDVLLPVLQRAIAEVSVVLAVT